MISFPGQAFNQGLNPPLNLLKLRAADLDGCLLGHANLLTSLCVFVRGVLRAKRFMPRFVDLGVVAPELTTAELALRNVVPVLSVKPSPGAQLFLTSLSCG